MNYRLLKIMKILFIFFLKLLKCSKILKFTPESNLYQNLSNFYSDFETDLDWSLFNSDDNFYSLPVKKSTPNSQQNSKPKFLKSSKLSNHATTKNYSVNHQYYSFKKFKNPSINFKSSSNQQLLHVEDNVHVSRQKRQVGQSSYFSSSSSDTQRQSSDNFSNNFYKNISMKLSSNYVINDYFIYLNDIQNGKILQFKINQDSFIPSASPNFKVNQQLRYFHYTNYEIHMDVTKTASNPGFLKINSAKPETLSKSMRGSSSSSSSLPVELKSAANTQDHQIILFSNQFDPNIIEYCYQAKSKNFNCYAYNFSTKILYLTSSKVHISKIINLDGLNFLTLSENNLDINLPKTAISLLSRNLDNFPDLSVLLGSTSTSSASANFPNQNHRLSLTLNFNQFSTTFNEMNNNKEKSIYNFLKLKTKPTDIDKHIQARDTFPKFLDSYFVHVGKVDVVHFDSKTGTLVMAIICQKEFDNYQKSSTGSESQRTSSSSRSQNSNHQNSNFKFKEISYELSSYTEIQLICNLVNPFQDFPISVSLILPTNEILILYQNNKICKFSLNRIYRKMYSIWSQCTSLNDKNNSGISWINTSKNDKCWKRPEQLIPNSPSSDLCLDFQKIYSRVPLFQTAGPAEEQIFQKSLKLELPPGSSQTTALISSNRNDQVVIFGTNAGELFKYSLKKQKKIPGNWHLGRDFGSILNGQVSNEGNLLAFSPKGFLYIPLDDCSKFKTCQECSNSLTETSCGWCVLEGKCVAQKTCPFKNLLLGQGELIPITDQNKCPRILENGLSPISFSNQQNFIEFDITVFSIPGHYKYFCVLKSKNSHLQTSVEAEERGNTPETRNLACNFKNKRANLIQQILNPELTYERLEWSLVYRIMDPIRHTITHETVIDQLDVTVYNCQKFDTCTACVNKKSYLGNDFSFEYSCFWSSLDGKCSRTGNDFDNFSNLVSENDKCQYLKFNERSVEYNGQAVLLPAIPTSAASQTLNFEILNSASSNPVTYFMRIYKNSQALFNSQCQILKSHQISCQISRNLKILNSDNFSEDYTVKIYQQNEKPQTFFIEPEFVQTVYNCQSSQSCGECLYNSKLVSANCGWCQNLGVCSDRKFCREQTRKNLEVDSSSKALEIFGLNDASQPKNQVDLKTPQQAIFNNQICKFPKILNFSPSIGVIQGGNQLNISGIDLPFEASKFDISLGQKSTCHTSKITFDKNLKLFNISCLVASSHQLEANEKIKISATNYQISAVSNQFYKFVLPKITKILPEHGTKSGGQILTIFGNFLVLGGYLKTKIYLDIQNPQNQKRINCKILDFVPENLGVNDQIICQIENQPLINTEVKCKFRNSETDKTEIATLHLEIFDQQVTAKSHLSLYKDPCVSEISPNWSILEGGMNISVLGSGFRNGKNYFMINPLDLDENLSSETRQPCVIQDDSMIICYSPPASTFNPDSYFEREINFEFDGNRFLTGGLNLKYFPSPVIYFQEKEFVITSAFKSGSGPEVNANSESGGVPTGDFSNTETTSAIVILGSNICNFTPAGYHTNDCNAAMQYLKIKINDQVAKIKALTDDTITVYPPSNLKSGVYDINVELGSTFKKLAGKLNYKTSVVNLLTSEVLYGSLGVLVLISIFIIILICHQQKKVENVENEQKLFVKKMMTDQSKKLQAEKNDMFYLLCQDQSDNENDDFYDNSLAEVHCFKDYLLKVLFNGNHYGKYCQLLTGSSKTGTLCGNTLGAVSRDSNYNINYYNTLGKVGYAGQTLPRSLQNNNNPDTCQTNSNTLKSLRKDLYHTNSDYLNDENFSQVISHNYQLKLRTLDELKENLKNKEFLAAIVSVLDDNLSANEKSNVSGLLCVIFLDNFDYLTEVLMSNLSLLVEKSLNQNRERYFLRQSSSVYEKMVNHWIGLLMYPFLKQKISKPLYLLYRNLRDSIYRGPVDFITGQARNTLAQDSQLRTQICDREVSLKNFYITVKIDPASEEVTKVKVISCDTISQVKHKIILKIYGPTLSYRPRLEDFALFYLGLEEEAANSENTNSAAKRPKYPIELLDRDPSSFIDKSGYRKINTLSHYKINLDGSKFAIVNKNTANLRYDSLVQASNLNQNNLSLYGNSSNNTMTRNMSLGMKFFNKNSVKSQNNSMNLESQGQHPGNAASFTMPPPPIFPPAQDTQNSLTRKSLQKNYSEGQTQLYSENFSPAANPSNLHSGQANKTSTSLLSKISNLVLPLTDKEEQENNPNYVESKSLLNNTSHIGLDHSNTSHSHNFTHSYQNSGNLMNLAATMPRNYPLNSYGYHQSQQTHQQPHHQHIKNQKSNISINKSSAFLNLEGQSNPEYDQVTNSTPNGKPSYEPLPKHNNFDQAQNLSQGHPNNNSLSTLQIASKIAEGNSKDDVDTGIGTMSEKGIYHLVKPNSDKFNMYLHNDKPFSNILAVKTKVHEDVQNLFKIILNHDQKSQINSNQQHRHRVKSNESSKSQQKYPENDPHENIPLCIKFLFGFFDQTVIDYHIEEENDLSHIWKSNSLMLRFWMDIISEPTILLDVDNLQPVDASMRSIATALMESCSTSKYDYTSDTPVNKLLFADSVARYWNIWLKNYYCQISHELKENSFSYEESLDEFKNLIDDEMLNDCDVNGQLNNLNIRNAVEEILNYVLKYKAQILENLYKIEDDKKEYRVNCLNNILLAAKDLDPHQNSSQNEPPTEPPSSSILNPFASLGLGSILSRDRTSTKINPTPQHQPNPPTPSQPILHHQHLPVQQQMHQHNLNLEMNSILNKINTNMYSSPEKHTTPTQYSSSSFTGPHQSQAQNQPVPISASIPHVTVPPVIAQQTISPLITSRTNYSEHQQNFPNPIYHSHTNSNISSNLNHPQSAQNSMVPQNNYNSHQNNSNHQMVNSNRSSVQMNCVTPNMNPGINSPFHSKQNSEQMNVINLASIRNHQIITSRYLEQENR